MTRRRPRRRTNISRMVKSILSRRMEKKSFFYERDSSVTTVGTGWNWNAGITGTGEHERIGNKVRMTGAFGEYFVKFNNTGTEQANIRIIWYIPKDPTDDLSGISVDGSPDFNRFIVLKDKFICLSGEQGANRNCVRVKFSKKWKGAGMPVEWSSGVSTAFTKNPLKIALVGSDPLNSFSVKGFDYSWFTDA